MAIIWLMALQKYEWLEKRTNILRPTLASMVHRGTIPYVRLGKRLVRFDEDEIERWLTERAVPAKAGR
jgi:excisionase family DNA binding protein